MRTIIKENTWLERRSFLDFGWGNGYVIVPEGHSAHGVNYDELNEKIVIHYGLTFSCEVDEELLKHWPELTENDLGYWVVGFDTAHLGDTLERWPKERIQEEANVLLEQLTEMG